MKNYKSNNPTKEKKKLFNFMEKNKKQGVVSRNKIREYTKKEGYSIDYQYTDKIQQHSGGKKVSTRFFTIKNKRGTEIAEVSTVNKKKPRVNWWVIN